MYQPTPLYRAEQVKHGEVLAAREAGLEMYQLMLSAGQAVFDLLLQEYGEKHKILVLCGGGNNGGDGYVVAKLAMQKGITVGVRALKSPDSLQGDALRAYQDYLDAGGTLDASGADMHDYEVIIDAMQGTGLTGGVRGDIADAIVRVNQANRPVIAVDVPSGLCSDTGAVLGDCVEAQHTVTFIGVKRGLVTGQARLYVGELHFSGLGVEQEFATGNQPDCFWDNPRLLSLLKPRNPCSHKGSLGKALLIGGDYGMGGAALIASRACLKAGAGLTACLTDERNIHAGLVASPEVMYAPWEEQFIESRLLWCRAIALGPGLGESELARELFKRVSAVSKPKVLDADGLSLLATQPNHDDNRIITPHPGEAAKLLGSSISQVESDRYQAVKELQTRYGGVVVLKGAGTIVCDGSQSYVCGAGNAGMATGGMGDALTGVLVALLAQGIEINLAARIGVMVHSHAADLNVSKFGTVGLSASDVVNTVRKVFMLSV
ncbi:NAD(P)H-hydrate dehydratase [Vibrio ponticus]|uniref:Bifunctional NAD(P)H-hydrate repair enzyme n=1 Tax=Vibrio ponticus TaxID=265668 RepID=A0A3N3DX58_9VIBR|nr:NAD(P)H-hydrate dehydratase [Vibrio ponticus]ROV59087.1 NAD(P)H-hydrate dehydratase [Vibrio ponticus]